MLRVLFPANRALSFSLFLVDRHCVDWIFRLGDASEYRKLRDAVDTRGGLHVHPGSDHADSRV